MNNNHLYCFTCKRFLTIKDFEKVNLHEEHKLGRNKETEKDNLESRQTTLSFI